MASNGVRGEKLRDVFLERFARSYGERGQPVDRGCQHVESGTSSGVFFNDESGAWYSSEMQSENRSNQPVVHFGLCKRRAMSSKFVHISKHITKI